MNGMGWGGMWFGWIFWLVIIGVIIWVAVTFVNNNCSRDQSNNFPQQESALHILNKHYAKSDINKVDIEKMK